MKESTAIYMAIDALLDVAGRRDRETLIKALALMYKKYDLAKWTEDRTETGRREIVDKAG